jgi:hypothetical protein
LKQAFDHSLIGQYPLFASLILDKIDQRDLTVAAHDGQRRVLFDIAKEWWAKQHLPRLGRRGYLRFLRILRRLKRFQLANELGNLFMQQGVLSLQDANLCVDVVDPRLHGSNPPLQKLLEGVSRGVFLRDR